MDMLFNLESSVTTAHRAKLAYIYVRQSTAGQVRQHQESTELQYRLVDRAAAFGWPKERIEVIDDDLGRSGTLSDGRGGFQRLIAEIGLGKAGLVLSLDASGRNGEVRPKPVLHPSCGLRPFVTLAGVAPVGSDKDAPWMRFPGGGLALSEGHGLL